MPHFLINSKNITEDSLTVSDLETVRHISGALRAKIGEKLKFIDENKVQYQTEIVEISRKIVRAKILKREISKRELEFKLFVAQSVLKTEAQGLFISNAAQIGVKGIFPFISDFSTVKENFVKGKAEKWQKVADEAFKQCERADLMKVFEIEPLEEILRRFKRENVVIFAERDGNSDISKAVKEIEPNDEILVVIGPEGGFSDREFDFFKKEGFKLVTLGNLIFKAPNAVVAGVSNLIFALRGEK